VVLRHGARGAEQVFDIVLRIASGGKDGHALAAEKKVFREGVPGSAGLGEDLAAGTVQIELAIGFGDAPARAVIEIGDASGGLVVVAPADVGATLSGATATRLLTFKTGNRDAPTTRAGP